VTSAIAVPNMGRFSAYPHGDTTGVYIKNEWSELFGVKLVLKVAHLPDRNFPGARDSCAGDGVVTLRIAKDASAFIKACGANSAFGRVKITELRDKAADTRDASFSWMVVAPSAFRFFFRGEGSFSFQSMRQCSLHWRRERLPIRSTWRKLA
jgi:hypothetical protein